MKIKQAMAIAEIIEVRHPLVESRITECGHEHGQNHWFKVTPLDVKSGDRILFGKWSGTEVKVDGEELLIMKESDILGVLA